MGLGDGDVPDPVPGQGGKGGGQCLPHPLQGRAAAVEQLQPGGGEQLPVQGVELFHLELLCALLIAQAADAVGLFAAHLLQQAGVGILPLVVHLAADGVDQVGLLPLKIGGHKAPPLGHRVAQQFSQQLRHRLQQLLPAGDIAVVDEAGYEAHALVLPLLADRVIHRGAVQPVQLGGQSAQVRVPHRAPAQDGRQQRAGGGCLPPQGGDELGREQAGLELSGRQIGEIHPIGQLGPDSFQSLNSFAERPAFLSRTQYKRYYSISWHIIQILFCEFPVLSRICLSTRRKLSRAIISRSCRLMPSCSSQ